MKTLRINRKDNIVSISVEVDLYNRKSKLFINKEKTEQNFIKILDKLKSFSKFESMLMYYNEIDYYDNLTNIYETPCIEFTKGLGKRKPSITYQEHGCIPKDWSEIVVVRLNDPKTMKPIEVLLEHFDIKIDSKQAKEIRNAMKGLSIYFLEI